MAQQEEFLISVYCDRVPTNEEIATFIDFDSRGKGSREALIDNPLYHAKRCMNIDIATWREDLIGKDGTPLLYPFELLEDRDLQHPYIQRTIKKLLDDIRGLRWRAYNLKEKKAMFEPGARVRVSPALREHSGGIESSVVDLLVDTDTIVLAYTCTDVIWRCGYLQKTTMGPDIEYKQNIVCIHERFLSAWEDVSSTKDLVDDLLSRTQ